jgi:hypothetical protein
LRAWRQRWTKRRAKAAGRARLTRLTVEGLEGRLTPAGHFTGFSAGITPAVSPAALKGDPAGNLRPAEHGWLGHEHRSAEHERLGVFWVHWHERFRFREHGPVWFGDPERFRFREHGPI